MRTDAIRKGRYSHTFLNNLTLSNYTRECVIPDVSRTYHFGTTGVNMNPDFQVRLIDT